MAEPEVKEGEWTREIAVKTMSYMLSYDIDSEVTSAVIEEMLLDLDIAAAIRSIASAVTGKEWGIKSLSGADPSEIELRFGDLDLHRIVKNVILASFKSFTIQEIVLNKDWTYKDVILRPNEYFTYKDGNFEFNNKPIPPKKFIIAINDKDTLHPTGKTDLIPLYKYWKIKDMSLEKFATIVDNYGDIKKWFTFDRSSQDLASVRAQAKMIKDIGKNGNVIALPTRGMDGGFNKDFGFITLNDLKTEVHQSIIKMCKDEISKYLLGATLTQETEIGGNYAAANAHREVRNDIVSDYTKKVRDTMQQLIITDAFIFGYDSKDFYFEFNTEENEAQEIYNMRNKSDALVALKNAGFTITKEYASKYLNIPLESLVEVQAESPKEANKTASKNQGETSDATGEQSG